ncbi:MAG: PKD domain-containing protein [Candidatus Kaiserbacteria bacterium]|nr:PKD domain-containing protein [Candidatus Kaiserbacteria bacterium]
MRIVGLFALAIFLPAFAHAAPPTLTTYTVSHDTIYPSATVSSGLATTTVIDTAFSEAVKVSIKIVSASGATIKSLYSSSSVTNPAPKVWDGTNVAGAFVAEGTYSIVIAATSTATGISMTDASKTITISAPDAVQSDASDTATASASDTPPEYIPIPTLRIFAGTDRTVSSGADTPFIAVVYDGKGNKRDEALVRWSFGDGMQKTGANVLHAYYDPGEYIAVVHVSTSDGGDARSELLVTVRDAGIRIAAVSSRGITLVNDDSRTLDLSLWRLSMGGQEFKIPADTQILAGHTLIFSSRIIELPIADSASLLYPNGEVAATSPSGMATVSEDRQPPVPVVSYKKVQTVEPIISTRTKVQSHDEEVRAPAVTTELAAVGAALPPGKSVPVTDTKLSGLFHSPWTFSFLSVMTLAGGAFIFL